MIRIIIPVSNDIRVKDLIESLIQAEIQKYSTEISIVMSVNSPTPQVENLCNELVQQYSPIVNQIQTGEKGIAVAKNKAIRQYYKDTEYFVFLDSDCVVDKSYIKNLLEVIKKPNAPKIFRGEVNFISDTKRLFSVLNCRLRNAAYKISTKSLLSPNIAVASEIYEKVGLLNENLKAGEDLEFSQRVTEFDYYSSYFPEIKISHRDDLHFFNKTIKTMKNYGKDRGFRVYRRHILHSNSRINMIKNAVTMQNYWKNEKKKSISFIIFCIGYLIISRSSTLSSIMYWRTFPKDFFLDVNMLDNTKRTIKFLPPEYDAQ